MTTFPALIPGSRTFTPGGYPHSVFTGINSRANRVRNSNVMLESQLRLSFVAITESEMLSILTHYQGQRGGYLSFPLPADVWSGVTAADFQLSGYGWIYREPPTVEDLPCGGHNVELILETVPPEGTALPGLSLIVRYVIAGGRAAAANGAALTIGYSISGGRAGLPGLAQTVTYTITGGDATGGASLPGLNLFVLYGIRGGRAGLPGLAKSIAYSIAGGAATAQNTFTWSNPNTSNPPANAYRLYSSGFMRLSTTTSSGYQKTKLLLLTSGTAVSLTVKGVTHTGTVSASFTLEDANTSTERVVGTMSVTPALSATTLSDGALAVQSSVF